MAPIEIGPDGAPIVTPANPDNSVDAQGQEHSSETPFVIPPAGGGLVGNELRGKNEQTPHTDKKENDALSEPSAPPLPSNLPPTIVPGVSDRDTATVPASEVLDEMPDPDREEREGLREKKQDILKNYLGQESNIPLTHEYWQLSQRLRVLDKERQDRAIVWGNRKAQTKGE